jgi:hypothetical protein
MDQATYQVRFSNARLDDANAFAADLAQHLRAIVPDKKSLQIDRVRSHEDAQDFGTTLVLVLGTAAAGAVAKGIRAWLAAHTGTRIEITDANGHVVAENIDASNASAIVKAWTHRSSAD